MDDNTFKNNEGGGSDMHEDAKELSDVLEVVSSKIPGMLSGMSKSLSELITGIIKSFYSPEAGINMGKAVGGLYKELVDSGIPQDVAVKMAGDYMLNIKDLLKEAIPKNFNQPQGDKGEEKKGD